MGKNLWLDHLRAYWQKHKSKGISYRQAMVEAKKTYRKAAPAKAKKKAPKARK